MLLTMQIKKYIFLRIYLFSLGPFKIKFFICDSFRKVCVCNTMSQFNSLNMKYQTLWNTFWVFVLGAPRCVLWQEINWFGIRTRDTLILPHSSPKSMFFLLIVALKLFLFPEIELTIYESLRLLDVIFRLFVHIMRSFNYSAFTVEVRGSRHTKVPQELLQKGTFDCNGFMERCLTRFVKTL
jgi:hypothetical protein